MVIIYLQINLKFKEKCRLIINQKLQINNSIGNIKNLVPNFFDKKKYVFPYKDLQFYLRIGLKIKKVHRVLQFDQ